MATVSLTRDISSGFGVAIGWTPHPIAASSGFARGATNGALTFSRLSVAGVADVLLFLRPEDQAEIDAAGVSAAQFLHVVAECQGGVVKCDGHPVCAWGVRPLPDGVGVPWMIATPAISQHWRELMRMAPIAVAVMRKRFRTLQNLVYAKNRSAVRFVERLGFIVSDEPTGPSGNFHLFSMKG